MTGIALHIIHVGENAEDACTKPLPEALEKYDIETITRVSVKNADELKDELARLAAMKENKPGMIVIDDDDPPIMEIRPPKRMMITHIMPMMAAEMMARVDDIIVRKIGKGLTSGRDEKQQQRWRSHTHKRKL